MPLSSVGETDFNPKLPQAAASLFARRAGLTGRAVAIARSAAKRRAIAAGVRLKTDLVTRAMTIIRRGIATGRPFAVVQRELLAAFGDAGAFQVPIHRLRLIIRQETLTAFNDSRAAVQFSEPVQDLFPFLQYLTVRDSAVRPDHAVLHGRVFAKDDPIWGINTPGGIYPPWDFNCRCTTRDVTAKEAARLGVTTGEEALTEIPVKGNERKGITVPAGLDHPRGNVGIDGSSKIEPAIRKLFEDSINARTSEQDAKESAA